MLKKIELTVKNRLEFVKFASKELSSFCPVNGRPDYYNLEIEFTPNKYTLEVSTLREFILGFRDANIFAENLADEISQALYELLEPCYLSVKLSNKPENGIGIEVFQQLGWEKKL